MPNRIIKESICVSETIDGLSWFEECFFYRLIVNCDDYGRFDARPAVLKSRLFPLKERVTLKDVSNALSKLAAAGCVLLYECDGRPYLQLPTWEVHQTVRAKRSKYPAFEDSTNTSEIICNHMQADVPVIQSESESESESKSESNSKRARAFVPPSLEEVEKYCQERGNKVNAKQFFDFYSSPNADGRTWIDSKGEPVRNWKQKVIIWEGREGKTTPSTSKSHFLNYDRRNYTPEEIASIGINLLGDDGGAS